MEQRIRSIPRSERKFVKKEVQKEVQKVEKKIKKKTSNEVREKMKAVKRNAITPEKALQKVKKGSYKKSTPMIPMIIYALMRAIADPFNCVERWPDKYNSRPTAVCSMNQKLTANWTQSGELNADELIGFAFRGSSLRAFVISDQNPTSAEYEYNVYGVGTGGNTAFGAVAPTPSWSEKWYATDTSKVAFRPIITPYAKVATTYQPHGPTFYAGSVKENIGLRFFWLDASATVEFNYTSTANFNIGIAQWTSNGLEATYASKLFATATGATGTILSPLDNFKPGYYAFQISSTATQTVVFNSMTISGNSEVFCHLPIPTLEKVINSVDNHRVIGSSIMYTNTAAPLNREGSLMPYQLLPGMYWHDIVTGMDTAYAAVAALPGARPFEATEGAYIFHKPTNDDDWDFKDEYYTTDGNLIDCYYEIDSESPPVLIVISIDTGNAQNGYWTLTQSIEFFTQSQAFDQELCKVSYYIGDEALDKIKYIEQVHSNALHVKEIWSSIVNQTKKAGKWIFDSIPKIVGAVEKYGPTVVKYAPMAAAALAL